MISVSKKEVIGKILKHVYGSEVGCALTAEPKRIRGIRMEQNRSWLNLKVVLSIICIATGKTTNQVRDNTAGLPLTAVQSLVAVPQNDHKSTTVTTDGTVVTQRLVDAVAKPPSSAEGNEPVQKVTDKSQNEWIFTGSQKNKPNSGKSSFAEILHLQSNSIASPKQLRASRFRLVKEDGDTSLTVPFLRFLRNILYKENPAMGLNKSRNKRAALDSNHNLPNKTILQKVTMSTKMTPKSDMETSDTPNGDLPNTNASLMPTKSDIGISTIGQFPISDNPNRDLPNTDNSLTTTKTDTETSTLGQFTINPNGVIPNIDASSSSQNQNLDTSHLKPTEGSDVRGTLGAAFSSVQVATSKPVLPVIGESSSKTAVVPDIQVPIGNNINSTENHVTPQSTTSPSTTSLRQHEQLETTQVPSHLKPESTTAFSITQSSRTELPTMSTNSSVLPVTNDSALVGSKVEELQERMSGSECSQGSCSKLSPASQWTNDAYWAFGSLLTILLMLTAGVLYTGLWRKRNHMSTPISDVNCHSPVHKRNTDIKDFLKKKLRHIRSLKDSPLVGKMELSNGRRNGRHNGKHGSTYTHRYDVIPLLEHPDDDEEVDEYVGWEQQQMDHTV